ncbi:MAG: hypothetical protein Q9204_004681, partial [Flavoplaca sp. TL-2023a]
TSAGGARLGVPVDNDALEELDDQHYQSDENGEITVKSGGIPRDIVEKRARDALKANEASQKKRFIAMINRRIYDFLKQSNPRGSLLQVQRWRERRGRMC